MRSTSRPVLVRRLATVAVFSAAMVAGGTAFAPVALAVRAGTPACTDSWVAGASGDWLSGSNWSTGNVPTSTDVACINVAGTYTVTLTNNTTVGTLEVGDTSATVLIAAQASASNSQLLVNRGGSNAGTISLTTQGSGNPQNAALTWGGSLTSSGTISTTVGSTGGNRYIEGNLTSTGAISIGAPTFLDTTNATFDNKGPLTVSAAETLTESNGFLFNDAGGAITNNGSLVLTNATFNEGAGAETGTAVNLQSNDLLDFTGAGPSSFEFTNGGTLAGNIAKGQTLTLAAQTSSTNVAVSAPGSFTNAGTIAMTTGGSPTGNPQSDYLTWGGTLTNSGTISTSIGTTGGYRQLAGNLVNTGKVADNANLTVYYNNSSNNPTVVDNQGAITVNTNDSFTDNGQYVINDTKGSVTDKGTFVVENGGTFEQGAGTTADHMINLEGGTTLDFSGSGASSFDITNGTTDLLGNIASGQSVTIAAQTSTNNTAVVAPAGFTNAGTITLTTGGSKTGNAQNAYLTWNGVLDNTGTITSTLGTTGGLRQLQGDLLNQGTITLPYSLTLYPERQSLNEGTITVNPNKQFTLNGGSFTNGTGGTIANSGGFLVTGGATFEQGAGTTTGKPIDITGSTLSFTGSGASSYEFTNSGTLLGNLAAGQSLTIAAQTNSNNTAVYEPGSFTNAGTITLTTGGLATGNAQNAYLQWSGTLTNTGTIAAAQGTTGGNRYLEGATLVNNGTVSATVAITDDTTNSNWTNNGTVSIANGSSVNLTAGGVSYTQSSTGTLATALNANGTGAVLTVNGAANLGGTLSVATAGTPTAGTNYTVVTGTIAGTFATVTSPQHTYTVTYNPSSVVLTA